MHRRFNNRTCITLRDRHRNRIITAGWQLRNIGDDAVTNELRSPAGSVVFRQLGTTDQSGKIERYYRINGSLALSVRFHACLSKIFFSICMILEAVFLFARKRLPSSTIPASYELLLATSISRWLPLIFLPISYILVISGLLIVLQAVK